MSDSQRPIAALTELRSRISATDTTIPVIATSPFAVAARKKIGDEFVLCSGFGVDAFGWPVMTGCQRGLSPEEGGVAARSWPAGTTVSEVPWTVTEVVIDYPTVATDAMVGRDFAWDAGDGNVYRYHVVRIEGTPVIVWDDEPPATGLEFVWASAITGLTNINAVTLDPGGNIYTAQKPGVIKKWSAAYAALATTVTSIQYEAAATDGTNVVLTSVFGSFAIHRRLASNLTGAGGDVTWSLGSGNGQFVDPGPIGICFDGTSMWAVDIGNNRVQKFTASTGAYVSQFAVPAGATGIALGPTSTHLYVLCAGTGEIQKRLKSDHSLVATFTLGTGTADGQISTTAEGIALDAIGRIWIADTGNHRIQVFDSAGLFLGKVGEFGSGANQFKSPRQIAFNAAGDTAYIADSGNARLVTLQEDTSGGATTGFTVGPLVHFVSNETVLRTGTDFEWTNMPASSTELNGVTNHRKLVDLTDQTQYLFSHEMAQAGTAGAVLDLEYTTDLTGATGWTSMGGGSLSAASGSGWVRTGWVNIPTGAKAVVVLRVVGSGGNGTADPRWLNILAQFRGVGVQGPAGAAGAAGAPGANALISSLTDTASVDLTNTAGALSAVVLPAGVDHNSLANLTTGNPHTQYAPVGAKYIVQTADATLTAEQALGALATGIVKNTTTTGVLSIAVAGTDYGDVSGPAASVDSEAALFSSTTGKLLKRSTLTGLVKQTAGVASAAVAGTDYYNPGGTDVAVADGGTGASTAPIALTNLGAVAKAGDTMTGQLITRAGAAGAGTAGIKLQAGTLNTTPEAGAMEYDGSGFFFTPDTTNGRADDNIQQVFSLSADATAIGPTIADFFGTNSAIPVIAAGKYEIIWYLYYTKTTAGTVTYTIVATTAPTRAKARYLQSAVGGIGTNASPTAAAIKSTTATSVVLPATGSLTTAVDHFAEVRALLVANTAGNVRLRVTSSAGTVTPLADSYFTVRRIPANTGAFVA